jgi:hypothetical protein
MQLRVRACVRECLRGFIRSVAWYVLSCAVKTVKD